MNVGTEWLVEASGCRPDALTDLDVLRSLFARILLELDLRPVDKASWHVFPDPGGITGYVMLTESHLAIHTYPEVAIATLNLYCCREREAWPWEERLREILGATDVRVRSFQR
jgi:S-adenosylmethionine decarboxylase